jgi:hypothetical protein
VIKRIRLGAETALDAPADRRPVRIAVCTALPELVPDPKHDHIVLEWFDDERHLARCDEWMPPGGDLVVTQEHVLRGSEWLEERWRTGGVRLKHMALARRAHGLSQAEFSHRWKAHAGTVGTTPIPERARGRAYVQNHPLPREDRDWTYDAINEVYFDDVDGLRSRIEYFASVPLDDLFGGNWFVAAREEVLLNE